MAAINVVRFRVKPGRETEFVEAHRNMDAAFPGIKRAWLIKTGDRTYCIVGLWRDQDALASARPAMIANLDKIRDCLEDLGSGMGVTDPVSGEAIVELGGKGGKEGKKGRGPRERGAAVTPGGGGRGAGASAAAGAGGGGGATADARRAERRAQRMKERTGGASGGGKPPEKRRERDR